jgi:hypothetical protein
MFQGSSAWSLSLTIMCSSWQIQVTFLFLVDFFDPWMLENHTLSAWIWINSVCHSLKFVVIPSIRKSFLSAYFFGKPCIFKNGAWNSGSTADYIYPGYYELKNMIKNRYMMLDELRKLHLQTRCIQKCTLFVYLPLVL